MLKRMGRRYISTMHALRKWVKKPNKTDTRLLAQFYYADEELIRVTHELDSFDGRSEPERCSQLIADLKLAQEKVIGLIEEIKNVIAPGCDDTTREFRVKFPDDILQDNLAGQLWFGAECLCAGSTIVNREQESIQLRPLAKQVVKSLSKLRTALREQALKNLNVYPSSIKDAMVSFDEIFAQFEFEYVSVLSRVRSVDDHDKMLEISVLFCETVERAIEKHLLKYEMIEDYDPDLMISIPRLAIICGVLIFPDGPLDLTKGPEGLPQMFKPFYKLLRKIRDLLFTLSEDELFILEKTLCSEENFDEVVLAAEEVLKGSNYERKDHSKSRERGRSRRFGTLLPEHIFMPNSTYQANLASVETNIRDIQKKISNGTDCGSSENGENRRGSGVINVNNQNLTIITEVEVHNNSFGDENNESGSRSVSPSDTPAATLQTSQSNSRNSTDVKLSEHGAPVSPNVSNSSSDTSSLSRVQNPVGRDPGPPDYPPPPYSSAEEDGYDSSNEGDSSASNTATRRDQTSPSSARASVNQQTNSQSENEITGIRTSDNWPASSRSRGSTITAPSNQFGSDVVVRSGVISSSSDVHDQYTEPLDSIPQPISPFIESVENLTAFDNAVMQRLLMTPEPEIAQVDYQPERGEDSSRGVRKQTSTTSGNQDESGSSTSTLYRDSLFKDSSSETESEGLIPQKLHLLRSKFKCTRDLIHTLFVCISGVADQLQSNYANDLRQTLKSVFISMSSSGDKSVEEIQNDITKGWLTSKHYITLKQHEEPPPWTDDAECTCCSGCSTCFNFFKRRHHCRLCGKIFCSTCASNFVPLPRYGLLSPVRVCTACIETAIDRLV